MAAPASLPWHPTVCIETAVVGRLRAVGSVREAGEVLLDEWPADRRGRAHKVAVRACLAALEGLGDAGEARTAFIAAAQEAGIYVSEGRRR